MRGRVNNIVFYTRLAVYVSWITASIPLVYRGLLESYAALLGIEYYYYIPVLAAVLAAVAFHRARGLVLRGISAVDLVFSMLLVAGSVLMYVLAYIGGSELLLYVSMITWFWSWFSMLIGINGLRRMTYIVAASYLLVPLPQTLLFGVSRSLAYFSARVSAAVTGARIRYGGDSVFLDVQGIDGFSRYVVTHSCSGILGLLSLLPFIVAALYVIIYMSRSPRGKRALYAAGVIGLSPLFLVLGNTVRFILIIEATVIWGRGLAMSLFHTFPTLFFASAVQAVFLVAIARLVIGTGSRYDAGKSLRGAERGGGGDVSRGVLEYVAAVLLVMVSFSIAGVPAIIEAGRQRDGVVFDIERHGESVQHLLAGVRGLSIDMLIERRDWERETGVPIVYSGAATYMGRVIRVTVEVSPSAMLFHDWPTCLISQGYRVLASRIYRVHGAGVDIHYIAFSRGNATRRLYYFVTRIRSRAGMFYYAKVTLMGGEAAREAAEALATYMAAAVRGEASSFSGDTVWLMVTWLNIAVVAMTTLLIVLHNRPWHRFTSL